MVVMIHFQKAISIKKVVTVSVERKSNKVPFWEVKGRVEISKS